MKPIRFVVQDTTAATISDLALQVTLGIFQYPLQLRSEFGTSHSSTLQRTNALVTLEVCAMGVGGADSTVSGVKGFGEIGLPPKKRGCYNADYADLAVSWAALSHAVDRMTDAHGRVRDIAITPMQLRRLMRQLHVNTSETSSAAAVDDGQNHHTHKHANDDANEDHDHDYPHDEHDDDDDDDDDDDVESKNEPRHMHSAARTAAVAAKGGESRDPPVSSPPTAVLALFVALDALDAHATPVHKTLRCGVEIALLDYWGKVQHCSVAHILNVPLCDPSPPASFYTAALNEDVQRIVERARFGAQYTPLLKIKLDANLERGRAILAALDAEPACTTPASVWCIDANAAWSPELSLRFLDVIKPYAHRVFMVEQPFPLFRCRPDWSWRQLASPLQPLRPHDDKESHSDSDGSQRDQSDRLRSVACAMDAALDDALQCFLDPLPQSQQHTTTVPASTSTVAAWLSSWECRRAVWQYVLRDVLGCGDAHADDRDGDGDGNAVCGVTSHFGGELVRTALGSEGVAMWHRLVFLRGGRVLIVHSGCQTDHDDEIRRTAATLLQPRSKAACSVQIVSLTQPSNTSSTDTAALSHLFATATNVPADRRAHLERAQRALWRRLPMLQIMGATAAQDQSDIPVDTLLAWERVEQAYRAAGIFVYADESVCDSNDVEALRFMVSGVNVKMEKAGGYRGALDTIHTARNLGLNVWIGTMVGSVLLTNAAAALVPLATRGYGDVDGGLLVTPESQMFRGGFVFGQHGTLHYPSRDQRGVGVALKPTTSKQ